MKARHDVVVTTKTVEVKNPIIVLDLTPYQAEVIAAVVQKIGGWPEGPRGVFEELNKVLHDAGIHGDETSRKYRMSGNIIIDRL